MNITYWNEREEEDAKFEELYDFTEEYGIEDLRPSNLAKLSAAFAQNESLAQKYQYNLNRRSSPKVPSCDAKCRKEISCTTHGNLHREAMSCKPSWDKMDLMHWVFAAFTDPWIEKLNSGPS